MTRQKQDRLAIGVGLLGLLVTLAIIVESLIHARAPHFPNWFIAGSGGVFLSLLFPSRMRKIGETLKAWRKP